MSSPTASAVLSAIEARWHPRRVIADTQPWATMRFLAGNAWRGVVWFVVVVVLVALGFGFATSVVLLPVALVAVRLWRLAARTERRRVGAFAGAAIPAPYRPRPPGGWIARAAGMATDPATWRDLAFLLVGLPLGIAELVVAAVALFTPLSFVLTPVAYANTGHGVGLAYPVGSWFGALVVALLAPVAAVASAYVLAGAARGHVLAAAWLLGPRKGDQLEERVDVLTRTRSGAMEAMLAERRRIERDLHDGAQQRLVALAMDLGMAKEKLDRDPVAARALIDTSHEEAKRVLADLRDLVRGIHPAVLTDRGLDAAVSAVAGRCPVPVTVDIRVPERLPEAVEVTAYFVVVEALTNVAKHAAGGATDAAVRIAKNRDTLIVEVVDDGPGGADPRRGTGLAGLADRVAALDGRLAVQSPAGGPTRVRAEIPIR